MTFLEITNKRTGKKKQLRIVYLSLIHISEPTRPY